MTTTILRIAKSKENPYVMLDRRIAENPSLSWKAKGLMTYMLSRPDDWQIRVTDLVRRSPDGASAVRSGLRELEQHGYIDRKQRYDAATGHFDGITLTVHEQPLPTPSAGTPSAGTPSADTSSADAPACDSPHTDGPRADKPHTDEPHAENRTLTNTESTKTEQNQAEVVVVVPPISPHNASFSEDAACTQVTDPILAQVVALYEQEIGGTLTAMIADELDDLVQNECRDLERWRAAFRISIGSRNRWKYARAIILHPERKPPREVRRAANQRSDRYHTANALGGRGLAIPSAEEIERLNREAERQLRERRTTPGDFP